MRDVKTGRFCPIDKNDLIKDILNVYEKNKDFFNSKVYKKEGKYSLTVVDRYYGNWSSLMSILNIELSKKKKIRPSDGDILCEIERIYKIHNKITPSIFREETIISIPFIKEKFGSLTKLLNFFGYDVSYKSYLYSDEELKDAIYSLYKEHGFINKKLIVKELNIPNETIINRIGKIDEVCNLLNVPYIFICEKFKNILSIISDYLIEKPEFEYTFDFLINPKTNKNLRIDAYFKKYNLCIEYDGEQHFKYKPLWHKSYSHFKYRKYLDELKDDLLLKNNINLIRFKYNIDYSKEEIIRLIDSVITK